MNIDEVRATAYTVPTASPEADGTLNWDSTTVIVVVARAGDVTGMGWTYAHVAAVSVVGDLLGPIVVGRDAMSVRDCHTAMRLAARNAMVPGLVGMALSAVDVALWDLKARLLGIQLVDLFGRAQSRLPVYGSGGFVSWSDDELRERLGQLVHNLGIGAVKMKIGERWGANERRDLHRMEMAREAIGTDVALMVDANGGYQVKQAVRVAQEAGALGVPGSHAAMRVAARNAMVPGLVGLALSAVDVALWELKARLLGVPLVDLFGRARAAVPVYGSGGFTTWSDEELREHLSALVRDEGVGSVKIKIAERWGADERRDLHRIEVAREAIGTGRELMVDANGGYQLKQAARVAREAAGLGVIWFEEPVSSDHLEDLALLRGIIEPEVTAGEYGTDPLYFRRMLQAAAVDCLQIDASRAGGYTGFLAAAAVADSFGLQVSAHCGPTLHAPVCAAVPNLRHIEWFADHRRCDRMVFDGVGIVRDGALELDGGPGHGVSLRMDAERYRSA